MNKIFNIGLPKTGTTSLNDALNILGYSSIHNPAPFRIHTYTTGAYHYADIDWDAITNFGEHFYPQLDAQYPNSKFILTTRNKHSWINSTRHWFSRPPADPERDNLVRLEIFGVMRFNEERFSYVYDIHTELVLNYFKFRPDSLLILPLEHIDPWKLLCDFLNQPYPNVPWPHSNKKAPAI